MFYDVTSTGLYIYLFTYIFSQALEKVISMNVWEIQKVTLLFSFYDVCHEGVFLFNQLCLLIRISY